MSVKIAGLMTLKIDKRTPQIAVPVLLYLHRHVENRPIRDANIGAIVCRRSGGMSA